MIASRVGRALGPGVLRHEQRENGPLRWVLDWTDARGHRHRQALSTDRRVAERMRGEIIRQRDLEAAGLGAVEGQSMELAELRDAYLADLITRVGDSQFRNVRLRLNHAFAALSAQRVRDLRVVDVLKFRAVRVGAGVSNRTANCDVAALRAMLNWGVASQLIADNPLRSIKRLPDGEAHQVRRRRAMSEDEVGRFLDAVRADDHRNDELLADRRGRRSSEKGTPPGNALRSLFATRARIPQAPLFEFLVSFGARYGEARTLCWADVDLVARTASLRAENTKTHRARCVPLSRAFVARLLELRDLQQRALRRSVGGADRVFLSPDGRPLRTDTVNTMRVFDRALEAAGIARVDTLGRKLDIHALRHTAATRFARNGTPLPVTQRILGHSDPKMTARVYTHLDVEDLRQAVDGLDCVGVSVVHRKRSVPAS